MGTAQAQTPDSTTESPKEPSAQTPERADGSQPSAAPAAPGLTTVEPKLSSPEEGSSSSSPSPPPSPGDPTVPTESSLPGPSAASEGRAASGAASSNPDAIFRLFQVHALHEKRIRFVGGLGGVAVGATALGITAALADSSSINPTPFYIMGGVTIGFGLLNFIVPSEAERIAKRYRAADSGHTAGEAEAFESEFRTLARDAARSRKTGATFSFALAAAGIGFGVAMLGGSFDMPESEANAYGSIVLGTGVGLVVAGVGQLVIPTPIESAYAEWEAIRGPNTLAFSVAPTLGGAQLGLSGAF